MGTQMAESRSDIALQARHVLAMHEVGEKGRARVFTATEMAPLITQSGGRTTPGFLH